MDWIKCSERLPTRKERIGCVFDSLRNEIRYDVTYPGFNGRWESENSLGYYINEDHITHWMIEPSNPKE